MPNHKKLNKLAAIVFITGAILALYYLTSYQMMYRHAFYRMLFYVPLILASFLFDGPRVKQVLLNLITNAIQASPAGERVFIKTLLESHRVVLKVIDHGCGITEEHNESVFHPFFSTKKTGAGLGLGIAKKIVEAHGGEVVFSPNLEKGVTFNVCFPL